MGARAGGVMAESTRGPVEEYLDRVAARDVRGARAMVLSELKASGGLARVINELLAPAMTEVGDRWYDGRWNAAQEHVASGISEGALSAASVRGRVRRPPADAPTAVLACPRGEAHVLPARFAAELLVEAGADVIVLGLPVPERDLATFVATARPTALILSCTEPLALPGVRDAIAAAHEAGIPVLVGGSGFGDDERRGMVVGADGWARRPDEAVTMLRAWRDQRPELAEPALEDREVAALRRLGDSFLGDAMRALIARIDTTDSYRESEIVQARSDLQAIVTALSCALLCHDDELFADRTAWSRGMRDATGVRAAVLDAGIDVIEDSLGPGFPGSHRMLAAARA
jgi:methanogenic corrinoid protein MtbC1